MAGRAVSGSLRNVVLTVLPAIRLHKAGMSSKVFAVLDTSEGLNSCPTDFEAQNLVSRLADPHTVQHDLETAS